MSFFEHLNELASRVKRALLAFVIAFAAVSSLPNPLHPFGGPGSVFGYNFLVISLVRAAEAYGAKNFDFIAPNPVTPITVFINVSLVLAVVISLPVIFY